MYGIPLHGQGRQRRSDEVNELIENIHGVYSPYSGNADENPAGFGVKLDGFDECESFINVADLNLVPTAEQLQEFQALWDALEAEEQALISQYGEPRVFFLTSSS